MEVERQILKAIKFKVFAPTWETWGELLLLSIVQEDCTTEQELECKEIISDPLLKTKYWHLLDLLCYDMSLLKFPPSYVAFCVLFSLLLASYG